MHMKHIYKFSIVTAVYNTVVYLEEMIESVINQDIGFEANVQLILVDDGSDDRSIEICKKYKSMYPKNIELIFLNHSGVSSARNEGIKKIRGKYTNFLDSDDKLEYNALSKVEEFFLSHHKEVDLVAIPIYLFDREVGNHVLNYKFNSTHIVDICKNYDEIQLSSSSTFIKSELLQKYNFDITLSYAEDVKLVTEVILEKSKYGVIADTKYYYRKRKDNSSALQSYCNRDWYLNSIEVFSVYMLELKNKVDKNNWNYIDYVIMYDLQWKVNKLFEINKVLNKSELNNVFQRLSLILKSINSRSILNQKHIRTYRKVILLMIKYTRWKCIIRILFKFL